MVTVRKHIINAILKTDMAVHKEFIAVRTAPRACSSVRQSACPPVRWSASGLAAALHRDGPLHRSLQAMAARTAPLATPLSADDREAMARAFSAAFSPAPFPRQRRAAAALGAGLSANPEQPTPGACQVALLLHCADLSSPLQEADIDVRITDRIFAEFALQARAEAAAGVPVTVLLAETPHAKASMEVGFISYIVWPAYVVLVQLMPDLAPFLHRVDASIVRWKEAEVASRLLIGELGSAAEAAAWTKRSSNLQDGEGGGRRDRGHGEGGAEGSDGGGQLAGKKDETAV